MDRYFLLVLVSPAIALVAMSCADSSSSPGLRDASTTPPDASPPCLDDSECAIGLRCVGGACVDACLAAEAVEGSIGCAFLAATPDAYFGPGSCFAAYVANASKDPIAIEVAFAGEKLDTHGKIYMPRRSGDSLTYEPLVDRLAPNDLAVIFLDEFVRDDDAHTRCPIGTRPLITTIDTAVHGTGRGRAFSLTTSGPASAYTIFPFGGAPTHFPTATMLLPATSFGTEYVAVDAWQSISPVVNPYIQLVGTEDDTKVTITPVRDIRPSTAMPGASAGTPQTWTLAKGEVLQLVGRNELIGSPIVADKPIGLFGGSQGMMVHKSAIDVAQQQIPPVHSWGREIPAVSYPSRLYHGAPESVPWRIVAAASDTELTYEPERPEGAPSVLGKGEHAVFISTTEFVVRSQDDEHPIYMSAYMTGGVIPPRGMGDAEFVNIVPTGQFLDRYVFLTDPTYSETSLVLVRARTHGVFRDVVLECAGTLDGWRPLGKDLEFARVDITRDGIPQQYANGSGACDHGRHEMRSDGPFSVTVWGWDYFASYAFTGGSGTRAINQVVIR